MYTVGHSRLISTGVYVPEERVTTRELMRAIDSKNRFGVPENWLEKVTGIKEKRVSPESMLPSDMAVIAAAEAMQRAAIKPSELDAIIYCGMTRDHLEPATAHIVQAKIGALNAAVFDVTNACHGFMNGIHLMDALVATGQVRRGIVVTGEQGKRFAQKAIEALKGCNEKEKLIMLAAGLTGGDVGAAIIMGPKLDPDTGFMGFMLQSQGQHAGFCISGGVLIEGPVVTDMPKIISESSKLVTAMFHELMYNRLKWKVEDLSKYVVHQVGSKIFKLHHQLMGVPFEIMHQSVEFMGNLTTGNIPFSIHYLHSNQQIKYGDRIYLSGTGSGISLSQAGLIWDAA